MLATGKDPKNRHSRLWVQAILHDQSAFDLAYLIVVVGLLILIFGVWGFIVLNSAEFGVPLTAYAIVFGLIGGGFAMIGVAQALRLLLVVVKNINLALTAR